MAAGLLPVDLNNSFITDQDSKGLVHEAEELGLPRSLCAWIKGIYSWCLDHPEAESIIGVTQGDCSNTHVLMELLTQASRRVIPFGFPHGCNKAELSREINQLCETLGVELDQAEKIRQDLLPLRRDLALLDRMTWEKGQVTGFENHIWQLCSTDFEGDPLAYHEKLKNFLTEAKTRAAEKGLVRLGILGVPTIMSDLHQTLAELGAQVVLNEVPRQFAMPPDEENPVKNLVDQYARFTYPYDIFGRIQDIKKQVKLRKIDGLIHYTQSFCYRMTQDVLLREHIRMPILTLEGDRPGVADPRTRLRLEAFIDVLR